MISQKAENFYFHTLKSHVQIFACGRCIRKFPAIRYTKRKPVARARTQTAKSRPRRVPAKKNYTGMQLAVRPRRKIEAGSARVWQDRKLIT